MAEKAKGILARAAAAKAAQAKAVKKAGKTAEKSRHPAGEKADFCARHDKPG